MTKQAEEGWDGMSGLIGEEVLSQVFGEEMKEDSLITFCGNPQFNKAMEEKLENIGYKPHQLLSWFGL